MFKAFRDRRPWTAVVLSLFVGPWIGMAFLNSRRWFLLYSFFFFGLIALVLAVLPLTFATNGELVKKIIQGANLAYVTIGAAHAYFIARRWRSEPECAWYARRWYLLAGAWIGFIAFLFGLRTFVYQPFNVPARSMVPTLNVGDAFLVSKFAYNSSAPQRGDVIVFWLPKYHAHFVKRVIGIPGDHVQMSGGQLVINGARILQRRVEDFSYCVPGPNCEGLVAQFEERLPGGRMLRVLDLGPDSPLDNSEIFQVPTNAYFVLGDNRDNSNDSRNQDFGFVPRSAIIGRAAYKYASGDHWVWRRIN